MRIVNSKEFYKLPSGTLYCNYEPYIFMELNIKGDTIYNGKVAVDYFYQPLIGEYDGVSADINKMLDDSLRNGTEFEVEYERTMRDSVFDDSRMYAIYNKSDILQLIEQLQRQLK